MKFFTLSILGALLALMTPFAASAQSDAVTVQCNDVEGIYVQFHSTFVKDYTENDFTISAGETREKYNGSGTVTLGNTWNIVFYSKDGYTLKSVTVNGQSKTINQNQTIYPTGSYSEEVSGRQKCIAGTFNNLKGKTVVVTVEKEAVETSTFTLEMSEGASELYTAKFSETGRAFSLADGSHEIEFNPNTEKTLVLTANVMNDLDRTTVAVDGQNIKRSLYAFYVPVTAGCNVDVTVEESQAQEFEITLAGVTDALAGVRVGYSNIDYSDNRFTVTEGDAVRLYLDDSYTNITVKLNDGEAMAMSNDSFAFTPTENTTVTIGATAPTMISVIVNVSDPAAFNIHKVNLLGEKIEGLQAGDNTVQLLSTKNTIAWSLNPGYGISPSAVICEGKTFTSIENDMSSKPRFDSPFSLKDLTAGTRITLQAVTYDFDKTIVAYSHPSSASRKGSLVFDVASHYSLPADKSAYYALADGYQTIDFCSPMEISAMVISGFIEADGAVYMNGNQIRQTIVDDVAQAWETKKPDHGDVYKFYPGRASVNASDLTIWTSRNVKQTATIKCDVINTIDHSAKEAYIAKALPGTLITITSPEDIAVRVNGEYIAPSAEALYAAYAVDSNEIEAPMGRTFSLSTEEGKNYAIEVGDKDDVTSGIMSVEASDINAPVEFYNLQGVRVSEPECGGIYIRKQGNSVSKVVVK